MPTEPSYGKSEMTDNLTPEQRSYCMSRIRDKDTSLEKSLRSEIHKRGLRFRKHVKKLPGNPDIVLPKYKTVILVHGCFWHQHHRCKYATQPKSNTKDWKQKLEGNIERDKNNIMALKKLGWNVLIVWKCETVDIDLLCSKIMNKFPLQENSS